MLVFKKSVMVCLLSVLVSGCLAVESSDTSPDTAAMKRWQDMRFGMFIHWGPVALKGTEIGWSRGKQVPTEEYDRLYEQFNPIEFNADEWAQTAADAGMKYLVITAKHHDGFCLWPSAYTDYDIASTPFKRDVISELARACKKHDILFCTYYSVCDWYHPDYPLGSPAGRSQKAEHNMDRYYAYLKNQTKELIDNYGPLGLMWFDGEWEKPWTRDYGNGLYTYLKDIQPTLLINNRVSKGRHGMAGTTKQSHLNAGDFDTPEQRIGGFNRKRPWETCMTICRQWAWKPNDNMKSLKECIQTLLYTVGGDGNLLFNVGPMSDGRIESRQVERLKEMGDWLEQHGDTVYGTRGGPFKPGKWGASTCKDNKINLFVMNWPKEGPLQMPALPMKIVKSEIKTGGQLRISSNEETIDIHVPVKDRREIATVIELTVGGQAFEIAPADVALYKSGSVAFGKPAKASNVFQNSEQYVPAKALDDDAETRWATDAGTKEAWLEVDLGKDMTIDRAMIHEGDWNRVRKFELQYKSGSQWKTAYTDSTIGAEKQFEFSPVTARYFRLNILQAIEGPTIWEFQIFESK